MTVEFLKKYTDGSGRTFPKGKIIDIGSDYAKRLLKDKIVKPSSRKANLDVLRAKAIEMGINVKET